MFHQHHSEAASTKVSVSADHRVQLTPTFTCLHSVQALTGRRRAPDDCIAAYCVEPSALTAQRKKNHRQNLKIVLASPDRGVRTDSGLCDTEYGVLSDDIHLSSFRLLTLGLPSAPGKAHPKKNQ